MTQQEKINIVTQVLAQTEQLELGVLIGSQNTGAATANSDWDIAILWHHSIPGLDQLGKTEQLRENLARGLQLASDQIDLIEMSRAGLAIREVIANEGTILKGDGNLAWHHFLLKTWRDLEDWDWFNTHAA